MGSGSAPSLARVAGIHAVGQQDPASVELALGGAHHGLLDVAMLADFALGAAVRAQVGSGQPLPTLALTLEFEVARLPPGLSVRAWSEPVRSKLGRARGVLVRDGEDIGQCSATFTVPPDAAPLAPLPWEVAGTATPAPVPAAAGGGPADTADRQQGSSEALLAAACSVSGNTTMLLPGPAMLNRSGQVQGAVLFRLAGSLPGEDAGMVCGHLQFLAPAGPGSPVSAHPEVLGGTRRTLFVRSAIRQADRLLATGNFVFRRG